MSDEDDVSEALRKASGLLALAADEWVRDDSDHTVKHMRQAPLLLTDAFRMYRMYEHEAVTE